MLCACQVLDADVDDALRLDANGEPMKARTAEERASELTGPLDGRGDKVVRMALPKLDGSAPTKDSFCTGGGSKPCVPSHAGVCACVCFFFVRAWWPPRTAAA